MCVREREMGFVGVEFRGGCSRSLTKRWCKKFSGVELGVRPRGVEGIFHIIVSYFVFIA